MILKHLFQKAFHAAMDPERDLTERIFLILTFFSEFAMIIGLIGDLIAGESVLESVVIAAMVVGVPTIVLFCLHFEKLGIAIRLIVLFLVFATLPALFFFGGGLEGGGVVWFIFAFMYVGLVLTGRWRGVLLVLIAVQTVVFILISYFRPELVYAHDRKTFYLDATVALVLVGVMSFVMTLVQGRLLKEERDRAQKEAERAEELTRAQNRFFSSMSHEIRTPINSILGLNELILRDQMASDDIVRDASGIQGSGRMLLALINDILDFSKMEAGSMDIIPVDYRIGEMLSEIVNMMWLKAQDKGLGFEVSVDPEVPTVLYGDEVRIKQIIINLLNNAVKYTQKGRVELRVESREVEDDADAVELLFSISDTGMGIRKEDIPYLFDAFKRVDEGKNRHIEGTGLGLSIVKQLVELMDGSITVNSVYGEGSTFTVSVRQGVSDSTRIGELNIHNQEVHRTAYESSFLAPEARILIVDDNEMNLEVERRLLTDTDMGIDTALGGKTALDMCQKVHYDVIFMDHLMPEMDGIECLERIRNQDGGLNRNTPVIILTANAGSENRALYNKAGFDGYLVKPVTGSSLEEMLIKHISREKVILRNAMISDDREINTADSYMEKIPVIITTSSMCDLPDSVLKKLHIPVIPFMIRTEDGIFKDGVHMDAYELIRHMSSGKEAESMPPDETAFTEFFADVLKKAHHLIHIAVTTSLSEEYRIASEAARSFENVTVINSACISSATGLLVLIACKLVQQDIPVADIITELEQVRHRLKCSFVINTTAYMVRKGLIGRRLHRIADAINLHPALRMREDKMGLGGLWMGSTKRTYRKYIHSALPADTIPDADVVFITYVDVPESTLLWIEKEIRKAAYFEHVVFQQASAAISSNCGPGSVGIIYFLKSNKSYNLASFIEDASGRADDGQETEQPVEAGFDQVADEEPGLPDEKMDGDGEADAWEETPEAAEPAHRSFTGISGLDEETAIRNSGSEEAFRTVLKIFYDSIPGKTAELENSYNTGDWANYTIKIHALKSSARLVGALDLGEQAERLEMAGKEDNTDYIREHHAATMELYQSFRAALAPICAEEGPDESAEADKPAADSAMMAEFYDRLRRAAEEMDCDIVEEVLQEVDAYAVPPDEKEKIKQIRDFSDAFDYDGIMELLGES